MNTDLLSNVIFFMIVVIYSLFGFCLMVESQMIQFDYQKQLNKILKPFYLIGLSMKMNYQLGKKYFGFLKPKCEKQPLFNRINGKTYSLPELKTHYQEWYSFKQVKDNSLNSLKTIYVSYTSENTGIQLNHLLMRF